jgi:RHS repeat-associated protein
VVWSATYDAFGKASVDVGATVMNNLRFPGQYYDQEIGLHYNWHRFYDPGTGRYVTEDRIGLLGGLNLFNYARNNPVNFIDSLGLYGLEVHYYKTYMWALEMGIDSATARIIAEANQSADESFFQRPENPLIYLIGTLSYHFPQGTAEQDLSSALAHGLVKSFGRSLHSLQDSFSHSGVSPLTHYFKKDTPDKYCETNSRDKEMERITKLWLMALKKSMDSKRNRPFR